MARQYLNLAEIYGQIDRDNAIAQQRQFQDYQMQRQMKEDQRADSVRGAFKFTDGGLDEKATLADLYKVDPMSAIKLQSDLASQKLNASKAQAESSKLALDNKTATAKYLRDAGAGVRDQASYDAWRNEAASLGAQFVQSLPQQYDPMIVRQQLMDADKYLAQSTPKLERVDLGGKVQMLDMNPFTNPNLQGMNLDKTATPDSLLTDRRMREENEKNRALTMRGQEITKRGQDMADSRAREKNAIDSANGGYSNKPLPATALKMQNDALDRLSISNNNNAQLGKIVNQIDQGKLDLGLVSNIAGQVRNFTGNSTESSRNLSSFKATLEKLRNDSLRLNAGVQTDGDAKRAWNELFENINDKELVKQRLQEIQEINTRGADLQKLQVENIRSNYNAEPVDFSKYEVGAQRGASGSFEAQQAPAKPKSPLAKVKSDADYNRLPKGTRFMAPDGTIRIK